MTEYQSFEEKYLGKDKSLGRILRETGKTGYGVIAGMFRIPTTIRKSLNKQTRLQREKYNKGFSEILGAATGSLAGACADIYFIQHSIYEASRENYTPAIALGLTNFASLWYEIGRKDKSKKGE